MQQGADSRVTDTSSRLAQVLPWEQVLAGLIQQQVFLLHGVESTDARTELFATVQGLGIDHADHRFQCFDGDFFQTTLEHTRSGIQFTGSLCRGWAEVTTVYHAVEVIPRQYITGVQTFVVELKAVTAFLGSIHAFYFRGTDDSGQCLSHVVVGMRQITKIIPNSDDYAVNDTDDTAQVLDEVTAARAVMLSTFTEDRIGAFWEYAQVGHPQVIAWDIDGEQLASSSHGSETGMHGSREFLEIRHTNFPW
ncbi:hypothetical protein D3C76_28450 [compost metagenome]